MKTWLLHHTDYNTVLSGQDMHPQKGLLDQSPPGSGHPAAPSLHPTPQVVF